MKEIIIPESKEYIATTFDNEQFVFTEEEYENYKLALDREIKVLHFKGMSIAVADIRRIVEEVKPESKHYEFEGTD